MPTVVKCKHCGKPLTPKLPKIYIKGIGAVCKDPCGKELNESKEERQEVKERIKSSLGCERER